MNTIQCKNAILLHSKYKHVSATHVPIFRLVTTIILLQLMYLY
jgi:hypothetical protein